MTNEEDKKRWKKEAKQLKDDLANRKKVIEKREVKITFPSKKGPLKNDTQPLQGTKQDDQFFKNQINFK